VYLLDTNVVSELRRPRPHGALIAWLSNISDANLFLSAVTVGELQAGVEITREHDPSKASEIESWLEQVAGVYNVLPIDGATFRIWARLMHRKPDHLIEDAMIAATALKHSFMVVTRNVKDFRIFAVRTLNPFSAAAK
jgi:predicted nucleic acid-binding protein